MTAYLLLIVAFLTVLIGIVLVQAALGQPTQVTTLSLRFPAGLEASAVDEFLVGVSGLLPTGWRRLAGLPAIGFEIIADESGIRHQVWMSERWRPIIERLLIAHLPNVAFGESGAAPFDLTVATECRLTSGIRPLGTTNAASLSRSLLANVQPLSTGEQVVVQWIVTPARTPRPVDNQPNSQSLSPGALTALKRKQATPQLCAVGRIGARAAHPARSRALVGRAGVAWHSSRAPGVRLRRRALPTSWVIRRLSKRIVPTTVWPAILGTTELVGLLGWPIDSPQLPGLSLGGCRQLAPSPQIPTHGTVIGEATFPGTAARPIAIALEGRLRHLHVVGPTGTGKSTLLTRLIAQDMTAGLGVVVIDPKGDLITDVLERVPPSRRDDVIVLDPSDTRAVGLNPLRAHSLDAAELVAENLLGLFKSLYRSSWGPRTDDIFRAALLTLAQTREATVCELPVLLTDASYRRRIVGALNDPIGLEAFWGWYEALSDAERLTVIGPVLNKVRAFTMRPRVRGIVGQVTPALDLRQVFARRQILLVSLSSGLLGGEAAALLGALVVAELWQATLAQAGRARATRLPVMAYLDEFQHFLHLPTPMAEVLAEARGLGLGMVLAHQHLAQLPPDTRDAVLANARSRVVFQLPAGDARLLARDYAGVLDAADLQGLGAYEVVAQVFAAGRTQPPATALTQPLSPACSDGAEIRAASRQQFGVDRDEVEAAISERHQGRRGPSTIGRRRASTPDDATGSTL